MKGKQTDELFAQTAIGGSASRREFSRRRQCRFAIDQAREGAFLQDCGRYRVYYEVSGSGPSPVFQTGISVSLTLSYWAPVIKSFSSRFTVLTFDARGQGHTTYGKGRATYNRLAGDTVRLMDVLNIERAHFFGHSDGGCIELELLLNFDDRVQSATLSGTP